MEVYNSMEKTRVVIVDDSPFSITVLRDILENNGYEVVGDASSLDEVKTVIKEKRPSLVTMDMTIPGTDGLECTRAVHEIDENIKVIVVSSMMDEEIVNEARKNRVSAYVQKPVDADELITAIQRVMASDELYQLLKQEYVTTFQESLKDGMSRMTKTSLTFKDSYTSTKEHESAGMTIIIGIIGKFSGRMLVDFSIDTANQLASTLLKREVKNNDELMATIGEFTNIVSGNACSLLNKKNKAFGFRVAPPSILYGESIHISAPDFNTVTTIADTNYGNFLLNVGFKRSEEKWM